VHLRPYRHDDLTAIHTINQGEVPAVGTETRDALGHIAAQSLIALVADLGAASGDTLNAPTDAPTGAPRNDGVSGTVAGFCLVLAPGADYDSMNYRWFEGRYDDFVYLDRIAIAPAFQRRGLGRTMYGEVERLARELQPGATHFTLEVNLRPRNETSLAFHATLGFAEVGRQETDYGTLVSLMAKAL
jgi:predicted GNAT superfamily acetyltransferase